MRIMILGNPNAGKTSLFNALTHQQKKVANWSGVTVQAFEAPLIYAPEHQLIDLPGFYSLSTGPLTGLEMQFAVRQLIDQSPDLIINVVNATQLERHLLLSTQLMELNIPMLMVITHLDLLNDTNQHLNLALLSDKLGLPVLGLSAYSKKAMQSLTQHVINFNPLAVSSMACVSWPKPLQELAEHSDTKEHLFALRRYLESGAMQQHELDVSDELYQQHLPTSLLNLLKREEWQTIDFELAMMDARYQFVHHICQQVLPVQNTKQQKWTERLDRIVLNRFLGWPIFFTILWIFFSIAVGVGGSLQQQLTTACDFLFNHTISQMLDKFSVALGLKWVIVHGLGQGISTMVSFLPVMACMNCFLALLESSGYMARVAFLFERIMRFVGLPGKAFLPLLIGFGCNVPAIMTARIVEGSRERLLTVLLSPFMSCSARLTIYAVFASLFFPENGALIVLSLYLLGVVMAILTGYLLRKFWLTGKALPLMIELPLYKSPQLKSLLRDVLLRLKLFIYRSGKVVVPFCMVLGSVQAVLQSGGGLEASMQHGLWIVWQHVIHPVFSPLGISLENWPAAIGLLTGTMAKEIVIATLNTLYSQLPHVPLSHSVLPAVPSHLGVLGQISIWQNWNAHSTRALMWAFGGPKAAYSYLLFVLLYIPCISTIAIIRQEVGRFWQWFALIWSLILAYSVASLFYQLATWREHPGYTTVWCLGLVGFWYLIILGFKHWRPQHVGRH